MENYEYEIVQRDMMNIICIAFIGKYLFCFSHHTSTKNENESPTKYEKTESI